MTGEIDLLQGTWSVTALEMNGEAMAGPMLAEARLVIKGNRFTSTGMGAVYKGTLQVDTSMTPHRLDMKFDAGPEKGNTNLCIYKLSGDTWKICIATRGSVRPSRFASPKGSGFAVETLTRGSAPVAAAKTKPRRAAPKAAVPAPTEFEGSWNMVSGVMNGQPMEHSVVQWVKRVTEGNLTSVIAGPQVMMKFEFTFDSSKSPKTIDYFHTYGANKGKTQLGIYYRKGDVLQVCVAAPGAARPAKFESTPGHGGTFTVWKRA